MFDRDDLIGRVIASLHRMQHLMAADPSNPLLHSTLTMQQLKMLLLLSRADVPAGLSGQDLASAMHVGLATVTGIVDRLVAAGLVDRREDPRDRRIRRVRLTGTGRATIDGIVNAGQESLLALLEHLDDEALRVVERAMTLMLDAAAAQRAGRLPDGPPATYTAPKPRRDADPLRRR
jgi:DNA-binding MarR family transcriptional regulator